MAPARNGPCTCGSGKKYKKCCSKWHLLGLSSPPQNGLPVCPKGTSLGIMEGPPGVFKERFLMEEPGNYIWCEATWDKVTGEFVERRGWYTVKRR
ncbi:MAG: SEC-C metal-binding domain-containing protein [Verrucomicrobia bacterium]|nr:SEC-C metal-binding domain-containing protein [Verrucomicrobiota bacterium]